MSVCYGGPKDDSSDRNPKDHKHMSTRELGVEVAASAHGAGAQIAREQASQKVKVGAPILPRAPSQR